MKRIIATILTGLVLLANSVAAQAVQPPEPRPMGQGGVHPVIPFPLLEDLPVELASADFSLARADRTINFSGPQSGIAYDALRMRAEYTMRYGGEKSDTLDFVLPLGLLSGYEQPEVLLDGEPFQPAWYLPLDQHWDYYTEEIDYDSLLADLRAQQAPFTPQNIDLDAPATLLRVKPADNMEQDSTCWVRLGYDPDRTKLVIDTGSPVDDQQDEDDYFRPIAPKELRISTAPGDGIEVLVIGENTLVGMVETYNDWEEEVALELAELELLSPREYLFRTYGRDNPFASMSPYPPLDGEGFYLRYFDSIFSGRPSTARYNAADEGPQTHAGAQFLNNWWYHGHPASYLIDRTFCSLPISFEPGQERVLQITYPLEAGLLWDEDRQQYKCYYRVSTASAGYWSAHGNTTLRAEHQHDALAVDAPPGAVTENDVTVYSAAGAPAEDLQIGFWIADQWDPPSQGGMTLLFFGVIASYFWPVTLILVIAAILFICRRIRRKREKNLP